MFFCDPSSTYFSSVCDASKTSCLLCLQLFIYKLSTLGLAQFEQMFKGVHFGDGKGKWLPQLTGRHVLYHCRLVSPGTPKEELSLTGKTM